MSDLGKLTSLCFVVIKTFQNKIYKKSKIEILPYQSGEVSYIKALITFSKECIVVNSKTRSTL